MLRRSFLVAVLLLGSLPSCGKAPDTRTTKALQQENEELRRENTKLKSQIEALKAKKPPVAKAEPVKAPAPEKVSAASLDEKPVTDKKGFSTVPKTAAAEKLVGSETKTYTVQQGDTLTSISRKIYNNPDRWKDIADANQNALAGSTSLKIGQVLILP